MHMTLLSALSVIQFHASFISILDANAPGIR